MKTKKSFSIIGAGNLGTHLLLALTKNGYRLDYIFKKIKSGSDLFDSRIVNDPELIVKNSDFIIISTQESKIHEASEWLAASVTSNLNEKVFFHTSNSLTSDELNSLRNRGASIASFSPLQTFPEIPKDSPLDGNLSSELFKGCYFQLEGDVGAVKMGEEIAKSLHSEVLHVKKEDKIYFHIAGVCASNFMIAILKLAENQLKKVGSSIDVVIPLIKRTLANVETKGVDASLSGPVKRKEMGIVNRHLAHLKDEEAELYKILSDFLSR